MSGLARVAARARSGTAEKSAALPSPAPAASRAPGSGPAVIRRLFTSAAVVLAVVLLFLAYLQVSRTYAENSDESNDLLMAWDMLHGNMLLHGWYLSDVSFYTTELPQYAMLEHFLGLHADTAHVAAAMTYTLVVVLAVLLARGTVSGRDAWPRMLLTVGIMFAPQLGVGVFILLLSLGHIGTAVPLMLIWLVLDRFDGAEGTKRRWAPVIAGLLLTWALIADPLVLVVGVVPLVAVCAVRSIRGEPRWYEVSLAAAAILAEALAALVNWLLRASGGFILHPVGYSLASPRRWPKHAYVTAEGLLALFGAKPQGSAIELAFALVHLAGVVLVVWAMWRVARHFGSWPDRISQILLVAIVINVAAYLPSTLADATDLNAREFAVVLPFGAVLAGRTLAAGLQARAREAGGWPGWQKWLASAVVAAYAASLGYAAAQPSVPAANDQLAAFLAAHHLTTGIGGYWESSVVTVGSDGAVTIRAVLAGTLQPDLWETKGSWYDPGTHQATFLVTDSQAGFFHQWQPAAAALAALGPPARSYRTGPYTVYVWDKNLLVLPSQPGR